MPQTKAPPAKSGAKIAMPLGNLAQSDHVARAHQPLLHQQHERRAARQNVAIVRIRSQQVERIKQELARMTFPD